MQPNDASAATVGEFTTTRDELWNALIFNVPSGYVETEGEFGPGRSYYKTMADLQDAFWKFCDAKEADRG